MAHGIGRIAAVGEDVVESLEASDGLVLAESDEEIGELVLGDFELPDGLGQGDKNGMARIAVVAGLEFGLPLVEQGQGGRRITDFVAEIVGDAAIGVDVEEILTEMFGQKPGGDGEIFVVGAGEVAAVGAGFVQRRGVGGNGIGGGQAGPAV